MDSVRSYQEMASVKAQVKRKPMVVPAAAKKKIAELKEQVKNLKEVVAKRNELVHMLHSQMYDVALMVFLYGNLQEVHSEMTSELHVADYYLLAYASMVTSFDLYAANEVFKSVPESQKDFHSSLASSCLNRMCKLGYMDRGKIRKVQVYFITTNGKYHLLNIIRKIRNTIVAAVLSHGKQERNIFVNKKLKKIYGY